MKDSLLYQKFFSSFGSETDLREAIQRENLEISQLIKQRLYPQADDNAIYYTGKHNNLADLALFTQGSEYIVLQRQFDSVIATLKAWGINNNIQTIENLDAFALRLKNPSDRITLLYGDGKKSLEIVTVLLEESTIDLELRKTLFTNLLADNELAKCIDGCYTRISNTAKLLLENRESANQINRWIRSYATEMARELAAKRPFAMPESYQRLICHALDISVEANELHVSNYLLSQAKVNGMPVEVTSDLSALEIANKVISLNKRPIIDLYLKQLESEISAAGLVTFIGIRLHSSLTAILSDPSKTYMEKVSAIEAKLNLIGRDREFLLDEIFDIESKRLKPKESFTITIVRRLTDKRWLNDVKVANMVVLQKSFSYYHFPNNIELAWLVEKGEATRFRFVDLLKSGLDSELSDSVKDTLLKNILRSEQFVFKANDIDILLNYNAFAKPVVSLLSLDHIKPLLSDNPDPLLLTKLLQAMSIVEGKAVLDKLTKPVIHKVILQGFSLANVELLFNINPQYFTQHYNSMAQKDALKVTRQLFINLLKNDYRDFSNIGFYHLKYVNYFNNIDFWNCNLQNIFVLQDVSNCKFDNSLLEHARFYKKLERISFINTDLRKTKFLGGGHHKYNALNLKYARISTRVFGTLLLKGIDNFSHADLHEIAFRSLKSINRFSLDFSYANLQSADLYGLDLRKVKFFSSNLKQANLVECLFSEAYLDKYIQLQGAQIGIDSLVDFYNSGVRWFDRCELEQSDSFADTVSGNSLEGASFKQAKFRGHSFSLTMVDCDLTEAKFIPKINQVGYNQLVSNKYERTKFINTEFHHVRFDGVSFTNCLLQGITLNDVKMPADVLFSFYSHGHRDFNGVKGLKGKIPDKLPPFPLSDAALSKEVFVHLYRQGLRDFRASHLFSFYLSETLVAQAASEIDLKLEGASYKQSLLGCVSGHLSHKRSVSIQPGITASRCSFYFLVQKSSLLTEKTISLADIMQLATEEGSDNIRKLIIREISFEHKPLFLLQNPDELKFYWGYQPDDESLIQAIDFTKQSTRSTEREKSYITFYCTKKFSSNANLKVLASDVRHLGFRHGQLNYYTAQGQPAALDLEGNPVSLPPYAYLDSKFTSILEDEKLALSSAKRVTEEKQRSQLYRIAADMKRRAKSGFRAGTRQGAQYELGFALMYFIATWITQRETAEPKLLDSLTKEELKRYAEQIVKEEVDKRQASDYIASLTQDVVNQCIDRGECSTQQLVREDIVDTLQHARPDIQVGYEVMWNKMKNFFVDIGEYLSDKFVAIKEVFKEIGTYNSMLDKELASTSGKLVTGFGVATWIRPKRKLRRWYDSPLLIRFIKTLELLFNALDYDINQVAEFSEAELAGFLYELWVALENCGITRYSASKTLINLLNDSRFKMSLLTGAFSNGTQACLSSVALNAEVRQVEVDLTTIEKTRSETNVQPRKKRTALFSYDTQRLTSFATRATQQPITGINSFANRIRTAFFLVKNSNHFYLEKTLSVEKPMLDSVPLTIPYVNQFKRACIDKTSQYEQGNNKKGLGLLHTPLLLETINNSLVLANFSLQVVASFFSNPGCEKKLNKRTVKFCNKLVKDVNVLIKKLAKANAISMVTIYDEAMILDFQNELYSIATNEIPVWREAVVHFRNRMCQRMDAQNVSKLKKFRFVNQLNEAMRDRFVKTKCYYITDFTFFQLNNVTVESAFSEENSDVFIISK
jgi:uncharacterized protein YjbI with pentapeptide repeats